MGKLVFSCEQAEEYFLPYIQEGIPTDAIMAKCEDLGWHCEIIEGEDDERVNAKTNKTPR